MKLNLQNYNTHAYALLRMLAGLLFLTHGLVKMFNFPITYKWDLSGMTIAAGTIEIVGGTLIVIGLFTRPAAFICSGMSAVGYWMIHGSKGLYPITNGGELIALYCFIFLFIATQGAGIWSLDNKRKT